MSTYHSDFNILHPHGDAVGVSYSLVENNLRLDVQEDPARRVEASAYLEPDHARALVASLTWALGQLAQPRRPGSSEAGPHCLGCAEQLGVETAWHDVRIRPDDLPAWRPGGSYLKHLGPGPYDHPPRTGTQP